MRGLPEVERSRQFRTRRYDAVIVGGALPGLVAAVRLGMGGARVCIVEEQAARDAAVELATRGATLTPFQVMEEAVAVMETLRAMAEQGQESSISDVGVGVLCARAAVRGAQLNVQINAKGLKDQAFVDDLLRRSQEMEEKARRSEQEILAVVSGKI